MKLDAVVFDLFGTLIDLMPDSLYEENSGSMAAVLGIPMADYRRRWMEIADGRNLGLYGGLVGNIRAACELAGYHPNEEAINSAARIRLEIIHENLKPRAHAVQTITWLKSLGIKCGLLSDTSADAPEAWPNSQFAPLFDATVFSCDVGLCKPDKRIYEHILGQLSVDPVNCLYIGDGGSSELTGAKNVGMKPVLIKVDYECEYDSRRPDSDWDGLVIRSLAEIPSLVTQSMT